MFECVCMFQKTSVVWVCVWVGVGESHQEECVVWKVFAPPMPFKPYKQRERSRLPGFLSYPTEPFPGLGGVHVRAWKCVCVFMQAWEWESYLVCKLAYRQKDWSQPGDFLLPQSRKKIKEKAECVNTPYHTLLSLLSYNQMLLPFSLPSHHISFQNEEMCVKIYLHSSSEITNSILWLTTLNKRFLGCFIQTMQFQWKMCLYLWDALCNDCQFSNTVV